MKKIITLLFILFSVNAQAACTTKNTGFDENGVTVTYKCDTEAEFPTSGLNIGDRAVALDTGKQAYATSATSFGIATSKNDSPNFTGNVGIGTTSIGGLSIMTGNVGIGTWSPTTTLQVVGNISASGTVSGSNISGSLVPSTRTVNSHALSADVTVTAGDLSLGNVTNTSDANKPVSTAQQTALDLKANLAGPTFSGTVSGITATMVGLGSVNNTADSAKPVSTAQQTALDLKSNLTSPSFTGNIGVGTIAVGGLAVMTGSVGVGTWSPTSALQVVGTATATAFSGPLTGNVTGNVTGSSGSSTGLAATATALAANGNNCSGNNFALGVDASGVGECAQPAFSNLSGAAVDAQIPDNITVTLASTVTTDANLTGNDVTSSGNAATLNSSWKGWTDGGTNVYESTTTDTVGIGTTTPNSNTTLEVMKQSSLAPLMISSVASGRGDYLIMNSVGNVGIGTRGPTQALEVNGTVKATTFSGAGTSLTGTAASLTAGNVTTNASLTGGVTSVGNAATVVTNANLTGGVTSVGNAATVVTNANLTGNDVTSVGNAATLNGTWKPWFDGGTNVFLSTTTDVVGIGTTTPASSTSLEVVKQSSNAYLKVSSVATGAGDVFLINSGGTVGIGTITPIAGAKLVVFSGNVGIGTISPGALLDIGSGGGIRAMGIGTTAQQGLCVNGAHKIGTFVGGTFNGTCTVPAN